MAYLDHNATSSLRPEARAAMTRALEANGNPSSVHANGRAARAIVEGARLSIASLVRARPENVVFTSGGTEANGLALWGAIQGAMDAEARITRIFVSAIEHDSVSANAAAIAERVPAVRVQTIPVTPEGVVDAEALRVQLREGKGRALVAVMLANNETGVVQPLGDIAKLVQDANALLLVDAIQAAGKIAVDLGTLDADYLTLSAHKFGGPQGTGALVLRARAPLAVQILHRAGTENIIGIAGFGAAAEVAAKTIDVNTRTLELRNRLEHELKVLSPDVTIFGASSPRLSNTSNFALPGIRAETAVIALDLEGVMVSSGAACSSGKVSPSHVLRAMGVSEDVASCALRVSFGWDSTDADVDAALAALAKLLSRARSRVAA
jgi:cysteine desulfurase